MRRLEEQIRKTPAEGLTGLAVKLGVWCFIDNYRDDVAIQQARSAYSDICRMIGRDFAAEAEAVVKKRAA
jgi:hypothetical protein